VLALTIYAESDREFYDEAAIAQNLLALVFGNEVTGLTIAETDLVEQIVHIRTAQEHTSLNLAVCTAVALSSLFTGRKVHQKEPGGKMLNGEGRAFLKTRLKEVFAGKVALTPSAANDIAESIDRVFSRVPLENRDARAWHLMLRALGSEMTPVELGLRPNERDGRRKDAIERRRRSEEGDAAPEEDA
jgi:tRNA C32,U32 (ribose-2'-O)-methylase TrmJ